VIWNRGGAVRRGEPVALVAGQGEFSVRVAEELKRAGAELMVVSVERDSSSEFLPYAGQVLDVRVAEGAKALEAVKKAGIRKLALVGKIVKRRIYEPGFVPDAVSGQVLKSAGREKGDDRLLKALALFLRTNGITVFGVHELIPGWVAPGRVLSRRQPDAAILEDLKLGLRQARAIGRLDIGQAVAVKGGTVIAVEGIEGTDAMIDRVGALGIRDAVLVKAAKPQQDLRFDMPLVGVETLERAGRAGFAAVGAEKGRTLLADTGKMASLADRLELVLTGV
jgi:DUF1009 family protein